MAILNHGGALPFPDISCLATCDGPNTASIHILDDDSLFNVLCLYWPIFLGEDGDDELMMNDSTEGKRDGSAEGGGIDWNILPRMW